MNAQEVKPCPFCGYESPTVTQLSARGPIDKWPHAVCCDSTFCKVSPMTDGFATREEAIAAWNNRRGEKA